MSIGSLWQQCAPTGTHSTCTSAAQRSQVRQDGGPEDIPASKPGLGCTTSPAVLCLCCLCRLYPVWWATADGVRVGRVRICAWLHPGRVAARLPIWRYTQTVPDTWTLVSRQRYLLPCDYLAKSLAATCSCSPHCIDCFLRSVDLDLTCHFRWHHTVREAKYAITMEGGKAPVSPWHAILCMVSASVH